MSTSSRPVPMSVNQGDAEREDPEPEPTTASSRRGACARTPGDRPVAGEGEERSRARVEHRGDEDDHGEGDREHDVGDPLDARVLGDDGQRGGVVAEPGGVADEARTSVYVPTR